MTLKDHARLEYSRLFWKSPRLRKRLLHDWEHPEHPHRERFAERRSQIEGLLECPDPVAYAATQPGESLRTLTREIPCVIWSLWDESKEKTDLLKNLESWNVGGRSAELIFAAVLFGKCPLPKF